MEKKEFKKLCGQIRRSQEYAEWKQKIIDRDGLNLKSPNVHHWKPFNKILIDNNVQSMEDARKCQILWSLKNGVTISKGEHRILSLIERMKSATPGFQMALRKFLFRVANGVG